ncbi:MAG: PAS domain S-box protein, partial [Candidatus Lokiarchaeota archaeon]|nr:PAS domain S-box protein [Candidatus Lokiarchaeota archaeon]
HRFEFLKKDGNNIFTRLETSPILNKEGNYDGAIAIVSDITNLVHSEFELLEVKEKFETISQQAFISIVILQDNRFKYFNDEFLRVIGFSREEIENWTSFEFLKIIHPDYKDFVKEQAIKKQRGDKDVINEYEFKGLKKSGEIYWAQLYSKTVNYEGSPADLIITLDITERKKAEEQLKLSEEKYRDIAELLPDTIYEADKNLNIVYVNSKGYQVFGYSPEDLESGLNIMELVVDEYKTKAMKKVRDIFNGEKTEPTEYLLKKKNGSEFYGRVHSRPIYKNGSIIGLRGTISDITEMENAKQKLKKSEERFRKLYTNIPGAMLLINQEKKIIDANGITCELTGYKKEELLGKKCDLVCSRIDGVCLLENPNNNEITSLDTYIKAKNGKIIPILKNIKKIEIDGKKFILENFQDITEKKIAEETLKKVNLLKTELMRRASHELKTPLVSIKGFTSLLLQKNENKFDEETISIIKEIEKGCERLQYLTNDILETSKLDSGNLKLRKTYENLTFLIRFVVNSFQGLAELRNIIINIDIEDDMTTYFEKERIYEVLGNLISNAIKYTPEGGRININSEVSDNFYIISIRDNGIGFTKEEKEKIFKQFGKIERYGQGWNLGIDGSGLGLYISKKIIEHHGGKIWMESKGRKKGSTFFFSLPITKRMSD